MSNSAACLDGDPCVAYPLVSVMCPNLDTCVSGRRSPWLGRVAVLCLLSASGCGASIHDRVARGEVERVAKMLEENPQLCDARDGWGKTPLHHAVTFAQRDALVLLLAEGCDPNAQDGTGMTPVHVAAFIDLPGAVNALVKAGADIEARDEFGDTPLHTSAMRGSIRMSKRLLRFGADPTATNVEGLRPSDLARKYGHEELAAMLDRVEADRDE